MPSDSIAVRRGLASALAAYGIWGVLPLYFLALGDLPATIIIAHRILWSAVLLVAVLALRGRLAGLLAIIRHRRRLLALTASGLLIMLNWMIYVYAIQAGHLLAGSLGYFLNPLANVALGVAVLGERLRTRQRVAVAIAAFGVALLSVGALTQLWISLALALSFSLYGLLRKQTQVGPMEGLAVETLLLLPIAVGWLLFVQPVESAQAWNGPAWQSVMVVMLGLMTSGPLLLFARAARALPLSTLGVIQYISPTLQFLVAVFVLHEPLDPLKLACFGIIWLALALFTMDMMVQWREAPALQRDSVSP